MTQDTIEAVARALLREEYSSEPEHVPHLYGVAKWQAEIAIRAYEAARGDVVVVPRAEYLILTAETRHKDHLKRAMEDPDIRASLRRSVRRAAP